MEDQCKLCWKSFVNGRALGGHMRSHMLHHHHHPLPSQLHPHSESASSSRFALQDRESETESSKKLTRKRSRVNRRSIHVSLRHQQQPEEEEEMKMRVRTSKELSESCTEQETVSSVSDAAATEEDDVAFTLMMLSRDERDKEDEMRCEKQLFKKRYECETCEKVFKSYQALGGHRASHKKKVSSSSSSSVIVVVSEDDEKKKKSSDGHECPICLKIFSSGQALGGHKRSHASVTRTNNSPAKRGSASLIDLNLPAPSEDEDLISSVF